jgi:small subunit ribosomal protein S6
VIIQERKQLRDYELTLIINPDFSEEQFEATLDNMSRFITERGGTVSDIDRWGKRRLAYPIKHYIEGNYVLAKIQIEPGVGKELEANLQISGDILRHLLVKLDS